MKTPLRICIVLHMKKSEAMNILGLSAGYTEEQIKQAHRQKIRENHPDRFSDPQKKASAEEQTKLINEARDVLVNRAWEPEYGGGRASGYSPYSRPYTTYRPGGGYAGGGSGGAGYGRPGGSSWQGGTGGYGWPGGTGGYRRPGHAGDANDDDPFGNWPFETFVWTSWGDADGTGAGGWPGAGGSRGAGGANPFDPFSSIFTQAPEKTAEQEAAEAKREMRVVAGLFLVKMVMLAACTLTGTLPIGVLVYIALSVIFGLFYHARGCSNFLIIPIVLVVGPAFTYLGRILIAVWPFAVALCIIAFIYDVDMLRRSISRYRTTQEKAKVSID